MKSAIQFIIGASILVTAFIVGSRWTEQSPSGARTVEQLQNEDLVWHSLDPNSNEVVKTPEIESSKNRLSKSTGTTRNRESSGPGPMLPPDNSRAIAESPSGSLKQTGEQELPIAPAMNEKIVMPDFANFEPNVEMARPGSPLSDGLSKLNMDNSPGAPPLIAQRPPFENQPDRTQTPSLTPMQEIAPIDPGINRSLPQVTGRQNPADPAPLSNSIAQPGRRLAPLRLDPDQELRLQTDEFRVYVTRSGDSLQRIAEQQMGSTTFYLDIYLANQDSLTSPAEVPVGIPLKIPIYRQD